MCVCVRVCVCVCVCVFALRYKSILFECMNEQMYVSDSFYVIEGRQVLVCFIRSE